MSCEAVSAKRKHTLMPRSISLLSYIAQRWALAGDRVLERQLLKTEESSALGSLICIQTGPMLARLGQRGANRDRSVQHKRNFWLYSCRYLTKYCPCANVRQPCLKSSASRNVGLVEPPEVKQRHVPTPNRPCRYRCC